jgi:hypothetical protein
MVVFGRTIGLFESCALKEVLFRALAPDRILICDDEKAHCELVLFAMAQHPGHADAFQFYVSGAGGAPLLHERPSFCAMLPPMTAPCVIVKRVADYTLGITASEWRGLFKCSGTERSRIGERTNEETDCDEELAQQLVSPLQARASVEDSEPESSGHSVEEETSRGGGSSSDASGSPINAEDLVIEETDEAQTYEQ